MKLTVLVENTSVDPRCPAKHGLSLYLETTRHRLLFDVGPDDLLLHNAACLGVDLSAVDTVILSHGHHDHGGGLSAFWQVNSRAAVYAHTGAFSPHFSRSADPPRFIGLDPALASRPQLVFTADTKVLDEELTLFSVPARSAGSVANASLVVPRDGGWVTDPFDDEQYLVVTEGEQQVLLTGCSHAGIVSIVEGFSGRYRRPSSLPPIVVGGFHLYSPGRALYESDAYISLVADRLADTGYRYATCHCTGAQAYDRLKGRLQDRLTALFCGQTILL